MKNVKILLGVMLVGISLVGCASKRAKTTSEQSAAQEVVKVMGVSLVDSSDETRVSVESSREPKYNVFKLSDPERIVVDLIDARLADGITPMIPGSNLVKEVRVQSLEDSLSALVRLEIFMAGSSNYLAGVDEKGLSVRLIKSSETVQTGESSPAALPDPAASSSSEAPIPAPIPLPLEEAAGPVGQPLPEIVANEKKKAESKEEIPAMPAPELKAEKLDSAPSQKEIVAEAKPTPPEVKPMEESLAPLPLPLPLVEEDKKDDAKSDGSKVTKKTAAKKESSIEIPTSGLTEGTSLLTELDSKIYTGKRVSLEFQDAEVNDVIRLIADVSKLNIITSDDVKGKLTLKLIDVPWDQALDIILTTLGLDKVQHGNILRVAPAEKLKKEREIALANDKAAKQLEPLKLKLINTNYASPDDMAARIKNMLSERGTVDTDSRTNTLIVKDIKENLSRIENLIKALDTQTPQVRIESRIVQANDSFQRSLGVQWGPTLKLDGDNGKQRGITFPRFINIGTAPDGASGFTQPTPSQLSQFAVDAIGGTAGYGGSLGFRLGSVNDIFNLDLRLSYAESENIAHIVSRPSISVLNNRTARIIQGTKIPFLSSSSSGANVQFQEAGIEISVTPQVTSDGAVMLKVSTKSNEPGSQAVGGNPQILIREANTEMLVKSARTAVLGGVFKTTDRRTSGGVPGLKDIPVFGWIFKGESKGAEREETLIFITPYILSDARTPQTASSGAAELEP